MKTFTLDEIKKLKDEGRMSAEDYLKISLSPKKPLPKPGRDILEDIRDCLTKMVEIGEKEVAKEEKIVVQAAAPVVTLSSPEPQVTVSTPLPTSWTAEITERDGRGFIKKIVFAPGGAR